VHFPKKFICPFFPVRAENGKSFIVWEECQGNLKALDPGIFCLETGYLMLFYIKSSNR
jgi:hypothetical protein